MKSTTLELPMLKPKTAQYLATKSLEEQKSVFDLLVELADLRAEYEVVAQDKGNAVRQDRGEVNKERAVQ